MPDQEEMLFWWLKSQKCVAKTIRKGFDSLVMLIVWKIWLERNNRVFKGAAALPTDVIKDVVVEGRCWITAGMVDLSHFISSYG
ncbi:hypothetical protein BAE44_0021220 [Dichanthelium oligosanthes]|uniref:Uncharacterized protein n=1 Tax=Dichanthelium oligosanthes TaxID=888268 RepID=A0A1E5UXX6_9POAL|nr:hypothetical protein BAE44_0021220 [Dichanthelium oligosanthes]